MKQIGGNKLHYHRRIKWQSIGKEVQHKRITSWTQSKLHSRPAAAAVFEIESSTAQGQWNHWRTNQKI